MTVMGSICECRLLARNLLKLPGNFQDCGHPSLIAACGWKGERRLLSALDQSQVYTRTGQTVRSPAPIDRPLKCGRG